MQEKAHLLVLCDWAKELVDKEESKIFICTLNLGGLSSIAHACLGWVQCVCVRMCIDKCFSVC